jgi:hypothetical protein
MKKLSIQLTLLGIAILGLASVAEWNVSAGRSPQPAQFGAGSQCVANVPRTWGQYKGGSAQSGLAFEAPDGTLRFVTNVPCGATPIVALEIRRTPAATNSSSN